MRGPLIEVVASARHSALHAWPDAPAAVAFLRHLHRHEFHVRCWLVVSHADREVEIIDLKRRVITTLESLSPMTPQGRSFGSLSCEAIATALCDVLHLSRCEVLEDGENGAEVRMP